jgi:hypothetical protein
VRFRAGLRFGLALVIGLAIAAVVGCGEEGDEPAAPRTSSTPAGEIALSIRYEDGAGHEETAQLTCRADRRRAGGFLDGKAAVSELCTQARALRRSLITPPDTRRVCTQIYGGPQTARVTGAIDGEKVDRRFTRTNGCEIADFDEASALLQP